MDFIPAAVGVFGGTWHFLDPGSTKLMSEAFAEAVDGTDRNKGEEPHLRPP